MKKFKVSVIIPVLNEGATLLQLIEAVQGINLPQLEKEIILIDAGSTDDSVKIIKSYEGQSNLKILTLDKQSGKGRAVREGLKLASGDIYLIQDGDLEYSTQDYPELLNHFLEGEVDFVIGSRTLSVGTWKLRFTRRPLLSLFILDFGGMLLTRLFALLYRVKISDPLSMFKIFKKNQINIDELKSEGFEIDWEILCRLIKKGLRFVEVPVQYQPRIRSEGKKLVAWREGFKSIKTICSELFYSEV
jgi:glycosyltransferase involved in cell wall biosynthesis